MKALSNYISLLNLDIAIGACINCYFFQWITQIELSIGIYILLFNTIWAIYTLDRIFDIGMPNFPQTARHLFHRKNQKNLIIIVSLLVIVNLWILIYSPLAIIVNGMIVAIIISAYLLAVKFWKKFVPKELLIALLYTTGVALAPLSTLGYIPPFLYVVLIQHTLIALLNLLIFSSYEINIDQQSEQFNLAHTLGKKRTKLLFFLLILLSVLLILTIGINGQIIVSITFFAMLVLLIVVGITPSYFKKHERYRFWADAAFLIPLWVVFL